MNQKEKSPSTNADNSFSRLFLDEKVKKALVLDNIMNLKQIKMTKADTHDKDSLIAFIAEIVKTVNKMIKGMQNQT